MKIVLIVLSGLLLLVVGLVIILVAIMGIIDPQGAQLANDADPFGNPPPLGYAVGLLLFGIVVTGAGGMFVWLPSQAARTARVTSHRKD